MKAAVGLLLAFVLAGCSLLSPPPKPERKFGLDVDSQSCPKGSLVTNLSITNRYIQLGEVSVVTDDLKLLEASTFVEAQSHGDVKVQGYPGTVTVTMKWKDGDETVTVEIPEYKC